MNKEKLNKEIEDKEKEARRRAIKKTQKEYEQSFHHYKELCRQANVKPDPKIVQMIKAYILSIERGGI